MPVRFSVIPDQNTGEPSVLRGGSPSAEELRILKDVWGVRRIISLDQDVGFSINPECEKLGIDHIIIPISHESETKTKKQISNLKEKIVELFSIRPLYIHCVHGRDRTGLAVALWQIANGMSPDEALAEANSFEFGNGLSSRNKKNYTDAMFDDFNSTTDIVNQERQSHDSPSVTNDSRHSFDPGTPVGNDNRTDLIDSMLSDDKKRHKRQKLRRSILQNVNQDVTPDINDNMAGVGGYENNNPVLRGLGPIEPFGIYPFGYSMIY